MIYARRLTWETKDEVAFVQGLGMEAFRPKGEGRRMHPLPPRRVLLHRYLAAMPLRADWGEVNTGTVQQEVVALLEREAGMGGKGLHGAA